VEEAVQCKSDGSRDEGKQCNEFIDLESNFTLSFRVRKYETGNSASMTMMMMMITTAATIGRILLEKLIAANLVKKFPTVY
jgi:hypothetical protein